jgi:hypothetical protein
VRVNRFSIILTSCVPWSVYVHNLLMFGLDEVQIERLEKANKQT